MMTIPQEVPEIPQAWADLIKGLQLMATSANGNPNSPFWCEHDNLHVCADPRDFTAEQLQQLEELGFYADYGDYGFYSYKFGSA